MDRGLMKKRVAPEEELLDATTDMLVSLTRFVIALKRSNSSSGGRVALSIVRPLIEKGLKGVEEGFENSIVRVKDK